jgi:hypothetical protein
MHRSFPTPGRTIAWYSFTRTAFSEIIFNHYESGHAPCRPETGSVKFSYSNPAWLACCTPRTSGSRQPFPQRHSPQLAGQRPLAAARHCLLLEFGVIVNA